MPFSYAQAQVRYRDVVREARVNLARRRTPKRHVTIKYLEADFAELFLRALAGLGPNGAPDGGYRGRELARNTAIAGLALASGLRRQEFSYLLVYEVPALPSRPGRLPIVLPVPSGVAKGQRTDGQIPDPRESQIAKLKKHNAELKQRIARQDAALAGLKEFKTRAISQLAAQHDEIDRLRAAANRSSTNVRDIHSRRPTPHQQPR